MNPIYSYHTATKIDQSFFDKMIFETNNLMVVEVSRTPQQLHLTDTNETQHLQKYQQQQQSLLSSMQRRHENDKKKQEYLRKLHYIKMTMHEQAYRSQLQLLRSISSVSIIKTSPLCRSQEADDDSVSGFDNHHHDNYHHLDLLLDNYIDPIIQKHMSIPTASS